MCPSFHLRRTILRRCVQPPSGKDETILHRYGLERALCGAEPYPLAILLSSLQPRRGKSPVSQLRECLLRAPGHILFEPSFQQHFESVCAILSTFNLTIVPRL